MKKFNTIIKLYTDFQLGDIMKKSALYVIFSLIVISSMAQEPISDPIPIDPKPPIITLEYPRINITPSQPVEGDTVDLRLIKDIHSNGCVPSYTDNSYKMEMEPEAVYPPEFTIYISYTETWPPYTLMCTAVMTEYGPRFTFEDMDVGNYTVIDGDNVVGTFQVLEKEDELPFENIKSIDVDGVIFTIMTKKKIYDQKEELEVRYTIENQSMATVTYNFPSGCQFDMTIVDAKGDQIYWYMENMGCIDIMTQITLEPGESTEFNFPSYQLYGDYNKLKITAQMIGYDKSAVSVDIIVNEKSSISFNRSVREKDRCITYSPNNRKITIHIDRSQVVSVEAYLINGKKAEHMSIKRFLQAGNHVFGLNNSHYMNGILFVKIKAEDFSEIKKINLLRKR